MVNLTLERHNDHAKWRRTDQDGPQALVGYAYKSAPRRGIGRDGREVAQEPDRQRRQTNIILIIVVYQIYTGAFN